jgi:hypothetical protein
MAHGHAAPVLAAIRLGDARIAPLLAGLPHLDAEPSDWPHQATAAGGYDARPAGADGRHAPVRWRRSLGDAADSLARRGYCHV